VRGRVTVLRPAPTGSYQAALRVVIAPFI